MVRAGAYGIYGQVGVLFGWRLCFILREIPEATHMRKRGLACNITMDFVEYMESRGHTVSFVGRIRGVPDGSRSHR